MFDPRYDVRVVDGDGVFLISDAGTRLLHGALYQRLAPLIDGRRSTDAIVEAIGADVEPAAVYYAMNSLARKGYVIEAAPLSGGHGEDAAIEVTDVDGLPVVVTDDYLAPGLDEYNTASLLTGRAWLLLKPVGPVMWLGPLFRPGVTGCWQCLAHRLWQHRAVEAYLQGRADRSTTRRHAARAPADPATIARALAGIERDALEGAVLTRDLDTDRLDRHQLVRRPNCPACGEPLRPDRLVDPIVLQSCPARFRADGGHRTVTPEETWARFQHHVSPVTGIVTALERTPLDTGGALHVYSTGRNAALRPTTLGGLRAGAHSGSSGKGMTDTQARASGLCEAIERYSAVFQGDEPRIRSSGRALGDDAVHPARCMLFSAAQYAARAEWNARSAPVNRIPEPFDDDDNAVEWTPMWSMTRGARRYLPTAICYLGYPSPAGEPRTCVASSSGNAAGNTLEEACLQAVFELVERDAVALWWYSRARRPGVALETFGDARIDALGRAYADLGRELWVLDLTSDFDIPVFAAISRRTEGPAEEIVLGFGAHLDPHIGVRRALGEMNQGLAGSLARQRTGASTWDDRDAAQWEETATLANQPYLAADDSVALRRRVDYRDLSGDDLRDDVRACQTALERRGLEMLVLDVTRPDVAMPVVKVIVPGLRPYAPRFAAGRLYDVPVQLGWIPTPLTERQLNPLPMVP